VRREDGTGQGARLVRAEGRGVSDQYGVRDAACPISTGTRGVMTRGAEPPEPSRGVFVAEPSRGVAPPWREERS